jgi:4-amino-4-deoxy-L-arabinose transferase-like glycosyltransferase
MTSRLVLAFAVALLLIRLPSLVQPMGADQGLYSYIGERLLAGDVPYRDAWDQKPPAIHYTYAVLRAVWPADGVVALADLAAAGAVAWLLVRIAAASGVPGAGGPAALLFLLLSNPAFTRLGGVRLRGQCETFIAAAVAGAFLLLMGEDRAGRRWRDAAAGALLGLAFLYKYNAAVYGLAAIAVMALWGRLTLRRLATVVAGAALPVAAAVALFAAAGAARDQFDATITYNLRYSGETYHGASDALRYLLTFPIQQARVDALWTTGGAGCLILLALAARDRRRLFPVVWVGAACASIAINGSRGLPQYFVQANPALALAAAWGAMALWTTVRPHGAGPRRVAAAALTIAAAVAVWRVNQFPKLVEQTIFDARYALGAMDADEYLARYADGRKYDARDAMDLGRYLRAHAAPGERVYVFGFTGAAYVYADRASASRFFWSRPVIAGFEAAQPGYGAGGVLDDLRRTRPAVVALQRKDWAPDVSDSAAFFLGTAPLAAWLEQHYARAAGPAAFDVWLRRDGAS